MAHSIPKLHIFHQKARASQLEAPLKAQTWLTRIIESQNGWVARDLKTHPVPAPSVGWLPPPDQANQGPIPPGLEEGLTPYGSDFHRIHKRSQSEWFIINR